MYCKKFNWTHKSGLNFFTRCPHHLVTKFNFHSLPNELIEYGQHFFLVSLKTMMRDVDFVNVFGFKIKIFSKYRKDIINEILNHTITLTLTNTWQNQNWLNKWKSRSLWSEWDFFVSNLILISFIKNLLI